MHFRVLRILEQRPEISQRELANEVGISLGAAHYCLTALVDRGLVKLGNFRASSDKRRYAYVLTAKGASEKAALTGRFLARKHAEYAALREEIEILEHEAGLGADMGPSPREEQ
ncbi:MarR family EPS-associated transcriptional regulator [Roseovarius tibetensis]|uniref:MarR family EPS-associated transcriptional regulator n=1 Tax=Roseovarius tibetensis TaxID=2685897 RepID=UPI003D7FF07C